MINFKSCKYLFISLLLIAIISPGIVSAAVIQPTKKNFDRLPRYCAVKLGFNSSKAEWEVWRKRLPGGFDHIHHYCFAMHQYGAILRMFPKSKKEKMTQATYIKDALGNIAYMEKHADPNFVLMPEIMVLKGRVLEKSDRRPEAIIAYQNALKLKSDYSKAYAALSDAYKKMGDTNMAKKVLEKGLEKKPKSKSLKRRLKKLEK